MDTFEINGRKVGHGEPPYIIAEVSCNHAGSLSRALELISAAKTCGADAVKFQATTADTITLRSNRPEFTIPEGPWAGRNLWELYHANETPFEWFPKIKERADDIGITWFASVFSHEAIDLVTALGAPAIKISSFELNDLPLVKYAAETGKPLIMSTGLAIGEELADAVAAAEPCPTALLHCVSEYPTRPEIANLGFIDDLWFAFGPHTQVGISDHTQGIEVALASIPVGASIIEKHFRLHWHPDTEDSPFSLDEIQLARLCSSAKNVWSALRRPVEGGTTHSALRRSLFVIADVAQGEPFTSANVRSIRPGHGLPPVNIKDVLGRRAFHNIERGSPLQWSMIAPPSD